jgi:hypothetical protein
MVWEYNEPTLYRKNIIRDNKPELKKFICYYLKNSMNIVRTAFLKASSASIFAIGFPWVIQDI